MTTRDEIHEARAEVAELQASLAEVQGMLDTAEEIAAVGEAAKERAQQLLVVCLALVGIGLLLLVWGGRRKES